MWFIGRHVDKKIFLFSRKKMFNKDDIDKIIRGSGFEIVESMETEYWSGIEFICTRSSFSLVIDVLTLSQ